MDPRNDKTMKILNIVPCILGDNAHSKRIWNIDRILKSLGHTVHTVQYTRNSSWDRGKLNYYDYKDGFHNVILNLSYTTHLRHLKELCRDKYDLVYGNMALGTFLSLLGKLKKTPLIFDMHGDIKQEYLIENNARWSKISFKFLIYYFIEIMNMRFSDKIVCVSKMMIKYLNEEKGIPQENMAYITNGIDLEFFKSFDDGKVSEMREQLGLENKLVFGYIGGLQKWQGLENFIEAARKNNNKKIAFLIVGINKKQIVKEKNIIYVPRITRTQVPLYYSISDILVLPRPSHSATEIAAPTKFAEYVAMKKPVLVTNVGDAANLVRRYGCGLVVKNNSIKSLLKGIEVFRSKTERELNEMGRNSRKLAAKEFDWNNIKDNLDKVIKSI